MRLDHIPEEAFNKVFSKYEKGKHRFKIISSEREISKAGNEMITIGINLRNYETGAEFDLGKPQYLVATEKGIWKIITICKAAGRKDLYERKNSDGLRIELQPHELLGLTGDCFCDFGEENEQKRSFLEIKYFIVPDEQETVTPVKEAVKKPEFDDTDIPF